MSNTSNTFPINGSRSEMEDWINQQVVQDPGWRRALLEHPRQTLARLVGKPVPEQFKIAVIEETPVLRFHVLRCAGHVPGSPPPALAAPGVNLQILEERGEVHYLVLRHPAHDGKR